MSLRRRGEYRQDDISARYAQLVSPLATVFGGPLWLRINPVIDAVPDKLNFQYPVTPLDLSLTGFCDELDRKITITGDKPF
jgi:hypothetical protein